jgi:hypothetical protein
VAQTTTFFVRSSVIGDAIEAANPFVFWVAAMRLAWAPWLEATRAMATPARLAPPPQSR